MSFCVCAVIPTHRHVDALEGIIKRLRAFGLEVVVVDDGNERDVADRIASLCKAGEGVTCLRREENGGKGAAVLDGLRLAGQRGFSHVLQIDADGQHDIECAPALIDLARTNPDALVMTEAIFDDSVPRARQAGRWVTHIWVSINTLSPRIVDTMCGFRIYPIARTLAVVDDEPVARRMGFDIEIVVRLIWRGMGVKVLPVRVVYPEGNTSNFSLKENIGISAVHARLFFGMLRRAPGMLWRRISAGASGSRHWAAIGERGSTLGLRFLALMYRLFGRRVCLVVMSSVVFFFFLTGGEQRRASAIYLERMWLSGGLEARPGLWMSLRHFMSFGAAALDKFAAWTGNIPVEDIEGAYPSAFDVVRQSGKGAFILTAHLGNPEVIRAIGSLRRRTRVNVLVHTAHAMRFTALIEAYSRESTLRMIQVTDVGPDTAILLQTAVENGEIVVIVGDRIPVTGNVRISWANFLGAPAPFPQGPHILASILKCPVYLLFCVRSGKRHKVFFEPFATRIELPRKNREVALQASVQRYAERLEHYTRLAPLQWFNFYDYWHPDGLQSPESVSVESSESELAR